MHDSKLFYSWLSPQSFDDKAPELAPGILQDRQARLMRVQDRRKLPKGRLHGEALLVESRGPPLEGQSEVRVGKDSHDVPGKLLPIRGDQKCRPAPLLDTVSSGGVHHNRAASADRLDRLDLQPS